MGFDATTTSNVRKTSGVTPFPIMRSLVQAVRNARIVDPSQVWVVADDEGPPSQVPSSARFMTIRPPSFVWAEGEVFTGDNNNTLLSEAMFSGQTRITFWLNSTRDVYGSAEQFFREAVGPAPDGERFLSQMVQLFFEQDLVDEAGDALTNKPLRFVSLEMPPEGMTSTAPKPFRVTWEVDFTWDLTA